MPAINKTYFRILADGAKEPEKVSESAYNKLKEDATKNSTPQPEVQVAQTFAFYEAATLEEAQTLVPSEEVFLSYFNRGMTLRQFSEINKLIEDVDFEPIDGVYDLAQYLNVLQERKRMSPEEKALRDLKNLPDDVRQRILQALLGETTVA